MSHPVSDEILGAYIDNELDPAERAALLERFGSDDALRLRACALWQLKQLMRTAYPLPTQKSAPAGRRKARAVDPTLVEAHVSAANVMSEQKSALSQSRGPGTVAPTLVKTHVSAANVMSEQKSAPAGRRLITLRWSHAFAASLLLAGGIVSGWFAHGWQDDARQFENQLAAIRAQGGRVVLHLFSDEPARMEATLRLAEQLAAARDATGRPLRVELIANGPGLHLLRAGGSIYADSIERLQRFDNLRLVACREAIRRLEERGLTVHLLPGVEEAASAESELAARLTQGWRYVQS